MVDGQPVAHVLAATLNAGKRLGSARFSRLVVMPEWQGAGIGVRFLNVIAEEWYRGRNRHNRRLTGIIHTSHPGLAAALRRDPLWVQINARLLGESDARTRTTRKTKNGRVVSYGGHLRAVQGFRYIGDRT